MVQLDFLSVIGLGGGCLLGITGLLSPAGGAAGVWLAATASLVLAGVLVFLFPGDVPS
ncbi:MAG: hypothetical protein V5B34_19055 [Accumulibacter sp.]|jgi:hypothetical protein|uniref:hypothetical protein n=1 Tax=Accumulibacter sp. TaxID=2053492 RepID=UPI002FC3220A